MINGARQHYHNAILEYTHDTITQEKLLEKLLSVYQTRQRSNRYLTAMFELDGVMEKSLVRQMRTLLKNENTMDDVIHLLNEADVKLDKNSELCKCLQAFFSCFSCDKYHQNSMSETLRNKLSYPQENVASYHDIIKQLDSPDSEQQQFALLAINFIKNDIPKHEREKLIDRVFEFVSPEWPRQPSLEGNERLSSEEVLSKQYRFAVAKEKLMQCHDNAMLLLYYCHDWMNEDQKKRFFDSLLNDFFVAENENLSTVFSLDEVDHVITYSIQILAKMSQKLLPEQREFVESLYRTINDGAIDSLYLLIARLPAKKELADHVYHRSPYSYQYTLDTLINEDDLRVSLNATTFAPFFKDYPKLSAEFVDALIANVHGRSDWNGMVQELEGFPFVDRPGWYFNTDFMAAYFATTIKAVLAFDLNPEQQKNFLAALFKHLNSDICPVVCQAIRQLFPALPFMQQQEALAELADRFAKEPSYINRFHLYVALKQLAYPLTENDNAHCLLPLVNTLKSAHDIDRGGEVALVANALENKSFIPENWHPQVINALLSLVGKEGNAYPITKALINYLDVMSDAQCYRLAHLLSSANNVNYKALAVQLQKQQSENLAFKAIQDKYSPPAEIICHIKSYLK